ncbi:sugar ABC transporter permease (plasmid) [Peteryoungia desertarenae]|uniref:Sugar ABC transporter permease n=1 Tax=Peteryoungia desertarenae TaxID=1813451 RepID=A0ABX6QTC1_9HYPH|nr:sugar ABC transporter permease [Peteryoungia desertarenae]QLF71462.1 sugar ABC transporter permease [Peteryoungia desertarenae]
MQARTSAIIFAWLLVAPAVAYIAVIVAYPLVDTFILSFTDASLRRTTNWVGWANYEKIFGDNFDEVIVRTFVWTFFSVAIKMIIGTFGAVMLNAAVPGRTLFRILTMPPWIVPMAIGIFMWGWMYNGQFGMISGVLQRTGIVDGPVAFLAYGSTAFWATIFTDVWIGVPMVTLYMLAAMQAVPQDLYEAAWTDGAGRFYRFRRITLPLIMPAMITMSMLSLIATFNSFDIIWILTQGGPSGETTTMIIDTYKTAIGSKKYGEGAARAVLICIFLSIFCFAYFRITSRLAQEHAR